MTDTTVHVAIPRRRSRSKPVITAVATLLALWFGLTAPAVSPVAAAVTPTSISPAVSDLTVNQTVDPPFVVDRRPAGRGPR